jgi:hypothetical protein
MRQRIKEGTLIATSVPIPKAPKRGRSCSPAGNPAQNPPLNRTARSKKVLKKLLNNKIDYKPFTQSKETKGTEGNYWKLIYNTPKY